MKILRFELLIVFTFILSFGVHAQGNEYNLNETYDIASDGTLYLNSDDAEVQIEGTDRSNVHLLVHRQVEVDGMEFKSEGEFKMEVENRNGDLHIRENDGTQRMMIGVVREEYQITLEIPHNVTLNIGGDDDTYQIWNINGNLSLNADDSEVELQDMTGDDFDFDIDDGSIRMDGGQGALKLRMDDGEFAVRQAEFTEIDAESDDGDMYIETSLADEGFYLFELDDGDIEFGIPDGGGVLDIHYDDSEINTDEKFEKMSSGEERFLYRLPGGNAQIEIGIDDGNLELRTI